MAQLARYWGRWTFSTKQLSEGVKAFNKNIVQRFWGCLGYTIAYNRHHHRHHNCRAHWSRTLQIDWTPAATIKFIISPIKYWFRPRSSVRPQGLAGTWHLAGTCSIHQPCRNMIISTRCKCSTRPQLCTSGDRTRPGMRPPVSAPLTPPSEYDWIIRLWLLIRLAVCHSHCTRFLITQCRTSGKKPPCQNQLDSSSRFDRMPTCDGRTDRPTQLGQQQISR